jgi:hypothetical protein
MYRKFPSLLFILLISVSSAIGAEHPYLLFSEKDIPEIKLKARSPVLSPVAKRIMEQAELFLTAPVLIPSLTKRGDPDPPGEMKGLSAARELQNRVLTYSMAFTLSNERKYRDMAVMEVTRAINDWRIWVDTAHSPPYDLMTGEVCATIGILYDWLYRDLSLEERKAIIEGAEKRGLQAYLDSYNRPKRPGWFRGENNWNTVCNGGATILALSLGSESALSEQVLKISVPAMDNYWNHLAPDGGWDEGTGYWRYGHRYAFLAAEALKRSNRPGGVERFRNPGAQRTGYFPMVFNPGKKLSASFGDVNSRAHDPLFYLLGREYKNPDFIWFQDRTLDDLNSNDTWTKAPLSLLWRPVGEAWLPESKTDFKPSIDPVAVFPSIGWGFMAPVQPDPPYFLAFKNGSLAANHTHLDLNSITVGAGDNLLIVDLGNRPYTADYFSQNRNNYYEISTEGHNTILVGGKGQVQGRKGELIGAIKAKSFEAFSGIADGAYEVETPVARRHVLFVKKRYWILVDEIKTLAPQNIEMRFHTYGDIEKSVSAATLTQDSYALDIYPVASQSFEMKVVKPEGWIKDVRALSITSVKPSVDHLIATIIYPRSSKEKFNLKPSFSIRPAELIIKVGKDTVVLKKEDGLLKIR